MHKLVLACLFIFASLSLSGQSYLYLEQEGATPDYRWEQGVKIDVLLKNGDEMVWRSGYFEGGDSAGIILGTRYISYEQIYGVRYERGLLPFLGTASMAAAGLFTGIFLVNGIINDDSPIIRPGQIGLGVGLFGLGLLSRPFWYKKRMMEDGYRLRIINIASLD